MEINKKVLAFSSLPPIECGCKHKLLGTGVFFQSVGLIYCLTCNGWQEIKNPIVK